MVDAKRTAELFILMIFGLRVRSLIPGAPTTLAAEDVATSKGRKFCNPPTPVRERR
jgi:hypothetical protein